MPPAAPSSGELGISTGSKKSGSGQFKTLIQGARVVA